MKYLKLGTIHEWKYARTIKPAVGIFRNLEGVKPGRWGFYIYGCEFGSRNPGDMVGVSLKKHGLWPW